MVKSLKQRARPRSRPQSKGLPAVRSTWEAAAHGGQPHRSSLWDFQSYPELPFNVHQLHAWGDTGHLPERISLNPRNAMWHGYYARFTDEES